MTNELLGASTVETSGSDALSPPVRDKARLTALLSQELDIIDRGGGFLDADEFRASAPGGLSNMTPQMSWENTWCVCVCVCACLCVRVCLLLTIHCVMSGAPFSDCNFSSSGIFWDFPLLVSLIHPSPNPHTPQPTPNISLTPEFGTGNVSASRLPLPYTKLNPTLDRKSVV